MGAVNIGHVKVNEVFPQHLYHDKLQGSRRVDTAEQKAEAVREGWRPGYRPQYFPRMLYNALEQTKTVENEEELAAAKEQGWEESPAAFGDLQTVEAKIAETDKTLKELRKKRVSILEG